MKQSFILCMFIMLSSCLYAQDKNCKFIEGKDGKGNPIKMVNAPAKIGNLAVGKVDGKLVASYTQKLLFMLSADSKNLVSLRVDSVQIAFADNTLITLKALGSGTMPNVNNQITPRLTSITFSFVIDEKYNKLFTETKLKAFRVLAEKGAQYSDFFSDKQQEKLLQAFSCVK